MFTPVYDWKYNRSCKPIYGTEHQQNLIGKLVLKYESEDNLYKTDYLENCTSQL